MADLRPFDDRPASGGAAIAVVVLAAVFSAGMVAGYGLRAWGW